MSTNLDKMHFDDLKACDPADVMKRTGCEYDAGLGHYKIDVWGHAYVIDIENGEILPQTGKGSVYQDFLYLFILHYLMKVQDTELSGVGEMPGRWVSEKDMVGGAAFFRGPHLLPVHLIVDAFDDDLDAFNMACEKLKGSPIDFADAAFVFQITPKIPVAVLYWQGDDDFPGESKLLFDKTIDQHLPLDIIYALAVEVCHTLAVTAKA